MSQPPNTVGPVLETGSAAEAIVMAIRDANAGVRVIHRGSYLRVLVPERCVLNRAAVQQRLGREFRWPGDLELLMPSFKGRLRLSAEQAIWEAGSR